MDNTASMGAPQGPWYLRTSARTVGTVAGVGCMVLGVIAAISISPLCIFAGIMEVFIGMILLSLEAPLLCSFNFAILTRLGSFWEHRPHWHKAVFYGILGVLPFFFCMGLSTGLGSAAVLLTAFLYGSMAMGKRGAEATAPPPMTGDLGYGQMDRSGLVESGMYGGNKAAY